MVRFTIKLALAILATQTCCLPLPPGTGPGGFVSAICCLGAEPSPDKDYAEGWIGTYNGASDIYYANTGYIERNVSTYMTITRDYDGALLVHLRTDTWKARSVHSVRLTPQSDSCLCGKQQNGSHRVVVNVRRNADRVVGTIRFESYTTSGTYKLIHQFNVNVIA